MPVAIAVGVAVAAGASAVGATLAVAIGIGMAAASIVMAMSVKTPKPRPSQQELKQLLRSSRPPKSVIYGEVMVSGALLYAEEQVGDTKNEDGTYLEWLFMAIGVCEHPIYSVLNVQLNETDINYFGSKANYQVHSADTVIDPVLIAESPSWKNDMKGGNTTWMRIGMLYDRDLYSNGVPTPKIELQGKTVWDMRSDTVIYSNNAALVIADFLISYMGFTRERIITTGHGNFISAANLCDESVENPDGSFSKRYTVNGAFRLDQKPADVLHDMLASCGGILVRIGGNIGLLPAAYYGVATITITESWLAGDVNIQPEQGYSDAINTIKGTFVDPEQGYAETDFPPLVDAEALARDGAELSDDLKLPFVTNAYQAQRLADIQLKRSLAGGAVDLSLNLRGLNCYEGRVIELDLPTIGLTGEYRVVRNTMHISEGVSVTLQREDVSVYNDAIGDVFVPPPLTNLPVGGIAAPSGVQFLVESVGEVVQGQVTWQINYPQSISTDIRIKRISDNAVIVVGQSVSNFWKVNGLPADNYIVEVRTVTSTGKVSNWVSASFIVDVPPMPDSVGVDSSNWNIRLTPVVLAGIPAGTLFRFKYIADNESFLTGVPTYDATDIASAETIFTGSSFNHGGLIPDRYHHYWVQGINSYGESDWLYVRTGTTREQDLVTTVVERLESIEIISSNFVDGSQGYKIWAADPNDPTADGRAQFNDIEARGSITAGNYEGGVDGVHIDAEGNITSANYVAGASGYRLKKNGDFDANNGSFKGTVQADKIIGNVANIANAAVDTLTIAGNAVTVTASTFAGFTDVGPYTTLYSIAYNHGFTSAVQVILFFDIREAEATGGSIGVGDYIELQLNGTNIKTIELTDAGGPYDYNYVFTLSVPAGNNTFRLHNPNNKNVRFDESYLLILGTKR